MTSRIDSSTTTSHVAFSDETRFNVGRYRAIAVVTVERGLETLVGGEVRGLLMAAGVGELKWQKLRTARDRFAALGVMDCALYKKMFKTKCFRLRPLC